MLRLLLIEDDPDLGQTLKEQLSENGYQVEWCESLRQYRELKDKNCDVAIIDLNLPDGSGFEVVKVLQIPKIIMTAQNSPENRLQGLELGAHDFIPKPFLFKELSLKLDRLLSRQTQVQRLKNGVTIDLVGRTIEDGASGVTFLNERELKILKLLVDRTPAVVSRDEILNYLNEDDAASHRSIDNVIVKLRQLLKDEDHNYIKSVRGVGYQWVGDSHEF